MLTSNDILSRASYKKIVSDVENKEIFEYKKDFKDFNFRIHSSNFACDGINFKKGDYFVEFSVNKKYGNMAGCGCPTTLSDFFETFSSYEKALDYIINLVSKHAEIEIEITDEQLSLF